MNNTPHSQIHSVLHLLWFIFFHWHCFFLTFYLRNWEKQSYPTTRAPHLGSEKPSQNKTGLKKIRNLHIRVPLKSSFVFLNFWDKTSGIQRNWAHFFPRVTVLCFCWTFVLQMNRKIIFTHKVFLSLSCL